VPHHPIVDLGPRPWFDYQKVNKQSPNGRRLVQYFDKARIEITDPTQISGPLGGVTTSTTERGSRWRG
jgi:hypothetical protein